MKERGNKIRPVIVSGFAPPSLACMRSWGAKGMSVGMVQIRAAGEPRARSRYLKARQELAESLVGTQEGIRVVRNFLEKFEADGVTCISEKVALWINESLPQDGDRFKIWLPKSEVILNSLSKVYQIEAARKVGFRVLPTFSIETRDMDTLRIPDRYYPICIRPALPGGLSPHTKTKLVRSNSELKKWLRTLRRIDCPLIAQPFVDGPNLIVHGARTQQGKALSFQAFLVERKFEGVTLTIRRTGMPCELASQCERFTDLLDITGNYHFEFIISPNANTAYFLEINPRFGGTTAKVLRCGYDEPALALKSYGVIETIQCNSELSRRTKASSKQALLKYLWFIFKGRLTSLDYPREAKVIGALNALKCLAVCSDDVLSYRDISGSLALVFGNALNFCKKIRRRGTGMA